MTNAPLQPADEPTPIDGDGRTLRRKRNRDAVIASLIALIREGDLEPTVAKIADRAEVSHRSIFRYFEDLDDLARTAIETEVRDALPLAVIPNVGEGTLEHRIEGMIASRMRILTRTQQLMRVAKAKSTGIPEIDRGMAMVADMTRDQFMRHFKIELDEMETSKVETVVTLLTTQMSFEAFDYQRRMQSRTDDEIVASWRMLMQQLLG